MSFVSYDNSKTKNEIKDFALFSNKIAAIQCQLYDLYLGTPVYSIYGRNMRYRLSVLDN